MTSFWSTHDDAFGNVTFYLNDCNNQFKSLISTVKHDPIDKVYTHNYLSPKSLSVSLI